MTIVAAPARTVASALTDLASCLCAQIVTDGPPDVCFCGMVPGEAAAPMYGGDCTKKCGMAWVRLITAYPAVGVGVVDEGTGNCMTGIGYEVEMGMLRCTPIGEAASPPTPAELLAATDLQYRDLATMRKAVACCPGARDWSLGTYTPMGPSGGLVGGFWTVVMWSP